MVINGVGYEAMCSAEASTSCDELLGPRGFDFALVFELFDDAFGFRDVMAFPQVDGLIDAAAFAEGVEVSDFYGIAYGGDIVVRGNSDIASGHEGFVFEEAKHHTALGVEAGDNECGAFDKLELALCAA